MSTFKLENVWICELSYVYRQKSDNMMALNESNSKQVLIMKENAEPKGKIVPINRSEYLSEQPLYFNLKGEEFYHGTQKGIFNVTDIGKVFVVEREHVSEELLTEEEKETQQISAERIEELHRRLQFHNC